MNITFLIGNGFDIGVGLQSKYKDFYPVYYEKSRNKPGDIKKLSDEIAQDYENWADFEMALGEYTNQFNTETKNIFVEQIKDFEKEFVQYLKEKEDRISYDANQIVDVMLKALLEYYSMDNLPLISNEILNNIYKNHTLDNHVYNFINFNYTSVLEKFLNTIADKIVNKRKTSHGDRVDKIGRIIHVHGELNSYPIIGLNDKEQIANKELANDERFVRNLVKPALNHFMRRGNDLNATNIINSSSIICVYGMSLGATDKKWWQLIVKWLSAADGRQLVLFLYDENHTTFTQFEWLEKEDAVIDKLAEYCSDLKVDIEKLRARIHIAIHKNIFSMKLYSIDEKNYLEELEKLGEEKSLEMYVKKYSPNDMYK